MLEFIDLENKTEMEIYELLIQDTDFKLLSLDDANSCAYQFMVHKAWTKRTGRPMFVNSWVDSELYKKALLTYATETNTDKMTLLDDSEIPDMVEMWHNKYIDVTKCIEKKYITFTKGNPKVISEDEMISNILESFKSNTPIKFVI